MEIYRKVVPVRYVQALEGYTGQILLAGVIMTGGIRISLTAV